MQSANETAAISKKELWAGRIISALAVLFLLFDAVIHLMKIAPVVDAFNQIGYPLSLALPIGVLELVCLVVYVIPRSSVLGAILLTAYLGGATASQVRIGGPFYSSIILGVFVWGGLFLGDQRLRTLLPLRR